MPEKKKILIIGVNGFIGSYLTEKLLSFNEYEIYGLDRDSYRIAHLTDDSNFIFLQDDIIRSWDWIENKIKKCDIIIPLAAIAMPKYYIENPIKVFEIDFEYNLEIIKMVVKYGKYLIFPSTSEVYGKSNTDYFHEDTTDFVVGPIINTRWIYSTIKQLLDRVIYSYSLHGGLKFCCFRPFNWIGPKLDSIEYAKTGCSRVTNSFLMNLLLKKPIKIVGDGRQGRCFTDIKDGVDCLIQIIMNTEMCNQQFFNIGNPDNYLTVYELAIKCIELFKKHPEIPKDLKQAAKFEFVSSDEYYGKGYEDIFYRKPSIDKVKAILMWSPVIGIDKSLNNSIDYLFSEWNKMNDQKI